MVVFSWEMESAQSGKLRFRLGVSECSDWAWRAQDYHDDECCDYASLGATCVVLAGLLVLAPSGAGGRRSYPEALEPNVVLEPNAEGKEGKAAEHTPESEVVGDPCSVLELLEG
ncbi:unnamed protein product [Gadus morhua 'NCC']